MAQAWLDAPRGTAAEIAASLGGQVPEICTARLRLRAPVIGDYPAYREVMMSDRAQHMGGPFSDEDAFADFCQGVAGWMLRGAGMWTVCLLDDPAPLGWIYLWHEMGDAEPELGWLLTADAQGQGFAIEAARAVLPHATDLFGQGGFVSYVDPENTRSQRLAAALGAVRDAAQETPDIYVYRHAGAAP